MTVKKISKILTFILVLAMVLALTACGKDDDHRSDGGGW